MENLNEIKLLVAEAGNADTPYMDRIRKNIHLASVLYRTVYSLENYWRQKTKVNDMTFKPGAPTYAKITELPIMGWNFKINENTHELECTNHTSDLKGKITISLEYFEDFDKYIENAAVDAFQCAKLNLSIQAKKNQRELERLEKQVKKDKENMERLNEMLKNNGKEEDELF